MKLWSHHGHKSPQEYHHRHHFLYYQCRIYLKQNSLVFKLFLMKKFHFLYLLSSVDIVSCDHYWLKHWYNLLPLLTNSWLLPDADIKQNTKLQELFISYLSGVWQDFINYLISKVTRFARVFLVTVKWT